MSRNDSFPKWVEYTASVVATLCIWVIGLLVTHFVFAVPNKKAESEVEQTGIKPKLPTWVIYTFGVVVCIVLTVLIEWINFHYKKYMKKKLAIYDNKTN